VIFRWLCFHQVVQKQPLDEVSTSLNSHLMGSCVKNIRIKNYQNLIIGFTLQSKMSGILF